MAGAANAGTVRARLTLGNSDWKSRMNEAKKDMQGLSKAAQKLKKAQGNKKGSLM